MNMKKLIAIAAVVASVALSSWAATWNGVSSGFTSDGDNWIEGTAPEPAPESTTIS